MLALYLLPSLPPLSSSISPPTIFVRIIFPKHKFDSIAYYLSPSAFSPASFFILSNHSDYFLCLSNSSCLISSSDSFSSSKTHSRFASPVKILMHATLPMPSVGRLGVPPLHFSYASSPSSHSGWEGVGESKLPPQEELLTCLSRHALGYCTYLLIYFYLVSWVTESQKLDISTS